LRARKGFRRYQSSLEDELIKCFRCVHCPTWNPITAVRLAGRSSQLLHCCF
jgi:hypothetical protein